MSRQEDIGPSFMDGSVEQLSSTEEAEREKVPKFRAVTYNYILCDENKKLELVYYYERVFKQ